MMNFRLAELRVSVDVLLGLQPLEEAYTLSNSGKAEYWENRLEYLRRTRKTMWNEDYVRFLVRDVWKIDKPVTILDCGCGFGALGMLLMPVLNTPLHEGGRAKGHILQNE